VAFGGLRPEIPERVDSDFAALLRDAWADDASARPSAKEVLRRLETECSVSSSVTVRREREECVTRLLLLMDEYPVNWTQHDAQMVFAAYESTVSHTDEVRHY